MSDERNYFRGLRDVAACETHISFVDPLGALYYVGYDIDRLLGRVCYEEVIYLLLNRKLPNLKELEELKSTLFSKMKIAQGTIQSIKNSPESSHPMEILRTEISRLGEYDPTPLDTSNKANTERAIDLIAKVPTIVATIYRIRSGQEIVKPKKEYGFAENFLYMFRGKPADEEEKDAIDRFMILHADHGLNASTFSARVTASTFSDVYSAITSAIGTLKGGIHGGASERVMKMLLDVNNIAEVEAYVKGLLFDGKKVMGFGHRVYSNDDPRSRHLRKASRLLCQHHDQMEVYRKGRRIETVVHKEKKIFPNVDFYAAIALHAMGIPKEFFTLFFASSRVTGWTAHVLEQYSDSVLLRPTSRYVGAYGTKFVKIEKR